MTEFFAMGGYGAYVWPAYGIVTLVFVTLTLWSFITLRQSIKDLKDLEAIAPRRRRRTRNEDTFDAES